MDLTEYFRIAWDTLRQNKIRSLLTMLGVIIGVMSVVMLVALGEAAQKYVEDQFTGLGSNLILVTPGKQETTGIAPVVAGSFRSLTRKDALQVARRARGIRNVAPVVSGAGGVRYQGLLRDTMVIGATEEWTEVRDLHPRIGRFITRQDVEKNNAVVVLGSTIKEALFGGKNALNEKVTINRRKFNVIGVMEDIGVTFGIDMDTIVFLPLSAGQQMFHGGNDELFQIIITATNPEEVQDAIESIREILTAAHDYIEDFTIVDQATILEAFDRIFDMLRIMLAGLASISLLVGGIGIMNIMLVSVRERTREVGLRKAVGATRWDVGMQFLIESITLSAVGGVIGIFIGYLGTVVLVYFYESFPVSVSAWSVATAFIFSLSVGVFFGVYPALKATSIDPVEALRYE